MSLQTTYVRAESTLTHRKVCCVNTFNDVVFSEFFGRFVIYCNHLLKCLHIIKLCILGFGNHIPGISNPVCHETMWCNYTLHLGKILRSIYG